MRRIDAIYEMKNFSQLPYIDEGMRYSSTSYDREGYNVDYDQRLYIDENGDQVLMDVKGPGCVYKLFLPTVGNPDDFLYVYIDDCSTPSISGSIRDIFSGAIPDIPKELVEINVPGVEGKVQQSGYIMYMPIPFSKRIKVTTTAESGQLFYYHIDYVIYPPETEIESYSRSQDNSLLIDAVQNGLRVCGQKKSGAFEVGCGETKAFFSMEDSFAQITCLRLKVDKIYARGGEARDYLRLNHLRLKIFFDGEASPSVDAPLSGMFGFSAHGLDPNAPDYRTKCLAFGIDEEDWLYLKFPMPFKNTVEAQIENTNHGEKIDIRYEICVSPFNEEREWGYFKAKQIQIEAKADDKNDMRFLEVNGAGRFVGIVSSMDTDASPKEGSYLEGDEHIYIDGSRTPQVNGTGTEDFYNGAYYWWNGTLSRPFYGCGYNSKWTHGCVFCGNDKTYKSMAYRIMIGDSIPFRSKLIFDMEHGPVNDCYETVDSVLFYYLKDEILLRETDELSVSDKKDKEEHGYKSKFAMPLKCSSAFEGLCDGKEYTYRGNLLTKGGSSEFQLNVNEENTFVILRRLLDYSFENQSAEVYVDGVFCGVWYDAGSNCAMRLRESDFRLPAKVTENKRQIKIEIKPVSPQWSECQYKALCGIRSSVHAK